MLLKKLLEKGYARISFCNNGKGDDVYNAKD